MADFEDYKYELDAGGVAVCRMSSDIKAAVGTNAEPSGSVTLAFHVQNSGSRKQFGVIPRHVIATRDFSSGNDVGSKSIKIPVLTKSAFDSAAFAYLASVTYGGETWQIKGRNPEKLR
jgi:hypothetical protein